MPLEASENEPALQRITPPNITKRSTKRAPLQRSLEQYGGFVITPSRHSTLGMGCCGVFAQSVRLAPHQRDESKRLISPRYYQLGDIRQDGVSLTLTSLNSTEEGRKKKT